MSRWWRAYEEAVDDPKVLKLTDEQHRAWFNLLCVFSMFGGRFPDVLTISLKLRMQERKVKRLMSELQSAGLLDDVNGLIIPHNWEVRQYKSDVSTTRVKRFRERRRNVSETAPDTDSESDTERKKDAAPNGAPPVVSNPERDYFARVREVLGSNAGGLGAKLLKARNGSIPLARAAIEQASTKFEPREFIGRIIAGQDIDAKEAARARGDAW